MADFDVEDTRISDLVDRMEKGFVFTEVVDRVFEDQDVYLDGRFWDRCTFTRCRLISRLGFFRMGNVTMVKPRGLVLHGPAARWFELAKANEKMGGTLEIAVTGYRGSQGPSM